MRIPQFPRGAWWPTVGWRLFQLLTVVAAVRAGRQLLETTPYRIDVDVYRMGGRAWLDGSSLYDHGVLFHTLGGIDLPFTYPPLAAVVFSPFAMLSLDAASITITVITLVLLIVTAMIVMTRMRVWEQSTWLTGRGWVRRLWLALAIVALATVYLEPVRSNFEFGQVNVVLMALVIADLVPRETPWPRGMLIGLAIALKLTPAVFLLYLLLRRDTRALLTSIASAVAATAVGFVLAARDSWMYWTETIHDTDRIGTATYHTNQNIAGMLARFTLGDGLRFALWVVACFATLALTVWAVRRVLRAAGPTSTGDDLPVLAVICVAMFGLVVSPVSWSHHWVWALPAVLVTAVLAWRYRNVAFGLVSLVGVVLMRYPPLELMPEHRETFAPLWRQLVGESYVWWALALLVVAGAATLRAREDSRRAVDDAAPAHAAR
ncbi:MAG: glycosyltransferase 87 family protein [Mycobacterium sp.]